MYSEVKQKSGAYHKRKLSAKRISEHEFDQMGEDPNKPHERSPSRYFELLQGKGGTAGQDKEKTAAKAAADNDKLISGLQKSMGGKRPTKGKG